MFIELAEMVRCPEDPTEAACVVLPEEMVGRHIVRGVIGCPATRREYSIRGGVAEFDADARVPLSPAAPISHEAGAIHALLGVTGAGGYVVLVGSATRLAPTLAEAMAGVHLVAINAPDTLEPAPPWSLLRRHDGIPLRSRVARGVVLGAEAAAPPWSTEAVRVVLPGLRVVVLGETPIPGLERLASGDGLWVGQRPRHSSGDGSSSASSGGGSS